MIDFTLSPKQIVKFSCLVMVGLTIASFSSRLIQVLFGHYVEGYRLFNVDAELTIPAWYSSSLLFCCAGLLAVIARIKLNHQDVYQWHWVLLSLIFLGMSLDEAVGIHEEAIEPLRYGLNLSGIWYLGWVIPGILFVSLFALLYLKFLWHLPPQTRQLFALSAVLYVVGAIGIEMMGGLFWETGRSETVLYYAVATTEEFLEMLGTNLFLYALMSYISVQFNPQFHFADKS